VKVGDKLLVKSTAKNGEYESGVVSNIRGSHAKVMMADGSAVWVRTKSVKETATVTVNQDSTSQIFPLFTGTPKSATATQQVSTTDSWYALDLKSASLTQNSVPIFRLVQLSFKGANGTLVCQNLVLTDRRSSRFKEVPTTYDVKTVVSLVKNGGDNKPARLDGENLSLLHFKVSNGDNAESAINYKEIWRAVRAIADASILGNRVLINCKRANSPSGVVLLAYLLELLPLEQALPQLMAQAPWITFKHSSVHF